MSINAWVYMLLCRDGSYYVGSHRGEDVGVRVEQHQSGEGGAYTALRRPVELVWTESFQWITDAIAVERQIKGWSRAKKQALIGQDWATISAKAKRRSGRPLPAETKVHPSRPAALAPQDEDAL
jgi:putative endonuclease